LGSERERGKKKAGSLEKKLLVIHPLKEVHPEAHGSAVNPVFAYERWFNC
jgi:hypothetical protein